MSEPNLFPPNGSHDAKLARLEVHFYHIWQRQSALEEEIKELKKDRAALIRRIGGWGIWALVALLGAIVSKGSTLGYLAQAFLSSTGL
jgi:hypothetical protein